MFKASRWLLLVYSSLISNVCLKKIHNKKCVVKTSGRLLFSLFIINQYCMSRIALKVSERLLFKLFIINQYSMLKMLYYKNMCWNLVGGIFLVFSSLIQSKWGAAFFGLFIINRYCMPKMFYYKFYRTSPNGCFLTCCVLICLSN